jgi:hypothetical protein
MIVMIRGERYKITERTKITSGRNFGKTLFRLTDDQGNQYVAMAKGTLKANSRLSMINN